MAKPLSDYDRVELNTHAILHMLWSKAVQTEGYVKTEWKILEANIEELVSRNHRPEKVDGSLEKE